MRTITSLAILVAASVCATGAAGDSRREFVESWQGTRVVVQQPLYTLVYNETGRLGKTYRDKREGLTVVTPWAGTFFQFDGRDSEANITSRDPQQLMALITDRYRRAHSLDIGSFQRIEPIVVSRFEPGVELVVSGVRIEQNRVRLLLADTEGTAGQSATALTIQWPVDLSRSFTERPEVERLIAQFLSASPSPAGVRR